MPDLASPSPEMLYLVLQWTIRLWALVVVPFRRSSDSARAWLLLMLFLPVPGLLLYLLIGRARYPRKRRDRIASAEKLLAEALREIGHSQACRRPDLPEKFRQAERLIEKAGTFPALGGNTISLDEVYDHVIGSLVEDIDSAKDHVHVLTYIFADDEAGNRIIEALARAASRGVKCRVLIDAVGSRPWARRVLKRLRSSGVEACRALPIFPWERAAARADLRNHRKIVIIDGAIAYAGSQNLVEQEPEPGIDNEELVAKVSGPIVVELQTIFAIDWFVETDEILEGSNYFKHQPHSGSTTLQLLASGPDYRPAAIGQIIIALIHSAEKRVAITSPYFIPDAPLIEAMRTAKLRGVIVQLIVPKISDNRFVSFAQQSYYSELLGAGVEIHLYQKRFLHAKHISVDCEIALIGSSNADMRSFLLNAEVTLIAYGAETVRMLNAHQDRYIAESKLLRLSDWKSRPFIKKFAENMARLVSPLL